MNRQISLRKKMLVTFTGSISALMIIGAWIVISYISTITEESVEAETHSLMELKASEVTSFFAERARVVDTLFHEPLFLDYFAAHTERGKDMTGDKEFARINTTFKNLSDNDPSILSVFFAPVATEEYFDEDGVVGEDNDPPYFTTKRPWWSDALSHPNKLYVAKPAVDLTSGTISATVQGMVNYKGNFLGIGGIDILITTIGDIIDKINYKGEGNSFLLDENQAIVYFPNTGKDLELVTPIEDFDSLFVETEGFSTLSKEMAKRTAGMIDVTWRGEEYVVIHSPAISNLPEMQWTLGLLVPKSVVDGPINNVIFWSVLIVLLVIVGISVLTMAMTRSITGPLVNVVETMSDIAHGEGDLTRRIKVSSNDEIGLLANEFNVFADKIQRLIIQTKEAATVVTDTADKVDSMMETTTKDAMQQQNETTDVASAVKAMMTSVQEISTNAHQASDTARLADEKASEGQELVSTAESGIEGLAETVEVAASVVRRLRSDSDAITEVLDVIKNIAEQTNLLALNAAIEAARAGEQGRGFAVVADEVRNLASKTQESTANIQDIIETLRNSTKEAESAMEVGQEKAVESVAQTIRVREALNEISNAINNIQQLSLEIATSTDAQNKVASEINNNVISVKNLSDRTVDGAAHIQNDIYELKSAAADLTETMSQFKVD
jgi:methyl-accepting chemotaxis protein